MNRASRICAAVCAMTCLVGSGTAGTDVRSGVVGWRTDWTGRYPKATPPLHWSTTQNVAWKTAMPSESAATPIIVGEKLFVMSEPYSLLCLEKQGGKILWTRSHGIDEGMRDEGLKEYLGRCKSWFKLYEANLGLELERITIREKLMEMAQDDPALVQRLEAIAEEIKAHEEQKGKLPAFAQQSKKGSWHIGFSCATPVSNGNVVFVLYGNGVGALYDLAGNLKWTRFLRHRVKGYGQSMSPTIVGDVVAIHFDDDLFALDLQTGKTLWVEYELQHQGSPLGLAIGGTDVIVTTDGNVRRASDGTKLAGGLGLMRFHTPFIVDEVLWCMPEDKSLRAVKLLPDGTGRIQVKGAGGVGVPEGVYYSTFVIHDHVAYAWDSKNGKLHAIDLATRKIVLEREMRLGGPSYPSPAAAGRFVFVFSVGGSCSVIEPGWKKVELGPTLSKNVRTFQEVARNKLEALWSCPVFENDRMYVRTFKNLYCIQASDADKKRSTPPSKGEKDIVDDLDDLLDL